VAARRALEDVVIDPAFWRGRRVFITGHRGFKGAWLSLWLQQLGAEVFGYGLMPDTERCLYDLAGVAAGMTDDVIADVRNLATLTAALRRARPEVVVHMAAQAIVLTGYADPIETFSSNVTGTVTVLEAVRAVGSVRAVIAVTSDKCYENRCWPWAYRESDALGGDDPYSASKAAAELAVAAMRQAFFAGAGAHPAGVASVRAGNVIGGGDWGAHRLIPELMAALLAGRRCALRHPKAVRPWQHVLEPLAGYLCLAEALWRDAESHAGAWNFGPRDVDARPVAWIAEQLGRRWQGAPSATHAAPAGPPEAAALTLDSTKARSVLGWAPVWPLETALETIIDWYRAYAAGADLRACVSGQIDRFCRDAAIAVPALVESL
jgi:CDP-glucose 4,6-dehydratase